MEIMDQQPALPKYNLNEDQEKKEIVRQYRALLRVLKPKLKPGDKELLRRAFEI
jgi:GTP pyrophosphokinase